MSGDALFELPDAAAPVAPLAEVVALKRTAAEVKAALRRRHPESGGMWVCIDEAFSGIANGCGGIDLLAVGAWRSAKAPGLPGAGRRSGGWGGQPVVDVTWSTRRPGWRMPTGPLCFLPSWLRAAVTPPRP